jgi:hypothetical protein
MSQQQRSLWRRVLVVSALLALVLTWPNAVSCVNPPKGSDGTFDEYFEITYGGADHVLTSNGGTQAQLVLDQVNCESLTHLTNPQLSSSNFAVVLMCFIIAPASLQITITFLFRLFSSQKEFA